MTIASIALMLSHLLPYEGHTRLTLPVPILPTRPSKTSATVSQTTSKTPARTGYESRLHRENFASPPVWGSVHTSSPPTRTHAFYPTQKSFTGVGRTTVRTPTIIHYADDVGPSPYSFLRTPSPDASRTRAFPQKHSGTQSSSSDSICARAHVRGPFRVLGAMKSTMRLQMPKTGKKALELEIMRNAGLVICARHATGPR